MELPEEEVAYIAIHLAGKRTLNDALSNEEPEGGLVISDEIWALVSDMLDSVRTHFHFDFDEDIELRMNLARHLVPLAVRLRSQMNLKRPSPMVSTSSLTPLGVVSIWFLRPQARCTSATG